jgi:glycosyltransferase involved in cell wall biosynthesis
MQVVIPSYNEEAYLPATLKALQAAMPYVPTAWMVRVLVVDDQSTDNTAKVAREWGAEVVRGPHRGIGAARNFGSSSCAADVFVFVDADTIVPPETLSVVAKLFEGGHTAIAIPGKYTVPRRLLLRPLLWWWRWYAPRNNSTQGVFQAFERSLFESLGGYDEDLLMAEDTDLFDRVIQTLDSNAWKILDDMFVYPSMRRYEQASVVALWLRTNPLSTKHLRRNPKLWAQWYKDPPR